MSFKEVRSRIFKRWWVILTTTILFVLLFYPWASSVSYQSSIGLGMSFSSESFDTDSGLAYVEVLESFSSFLEGRFKSVEVQSMVAYSAGLIQTSYDNKAPFYSVVGVGAGFININFDNSDSIEQANDFLYGVKLAYSSIVDEWNNARLDEYKVIKMDKFNEVVVESEKPLQFQLLPVVVGWLLGVVIALILPFKQSVVSS
ncbi:MAG: hypothetical protein AAGF07_03030 [Patescibacteria group bacterium]